jgi:Kef-type K+ transport system membrane component KefB/nucleotide-binding universal stress UspA family protein
MRAAAARLERFARTLVIAAALAGVVIAPSARAERAGEPALRAQAGAAVEPVRSETAAPESRDAQPASPTDAAARRPPPSGGRAVFLLLTQLAALLAAARVGTELARRAGLPSVIGELAAGLALGPTVLGHFAPGAFAALFPAEEGGLILLESVGTLGMVLLLLLTGLETDLKLLRNLGKAALIASAMGMLVPFASGYALGELLPDRYLAQPSQRTLFSLFLATAMAISAMPVIAKILIDLGLAQRNIGLVILSAGVVDDTAGWLVLSVIAGMASYGSFQLASLLATLGLLAAFVVAAAALYPLARRAVALASHRFRSADADLVLLLVVTFLFAGATEWIGVHSVFGAFVAGTLFRQVPGLRRETVERLESFVLAVLAPVFFGIVGLQVDLWAIGNWGVLALVLGVACAGKLVGCTLGSVWGGMRLWEGLSIAVAMNARGAMGLVVATVGLSLGILSAEMFAIIVMVAIVTSFLAPLGLKLTMRKVRITEDETRRILAERLKGFFDPLRVRVLLPTSGGPNSVGAAVLAAGLCKRSAHPVEVVHVRARRSFGELVQQWLGLARTDLSVATRSQIEEQVHRAGLASSLRAIEADDVAATIVAEARRGYDVAVLGASRRGEGLGGPVLEAVVRDARCHVVIVHARVAPDRFRHLYVPYDGGVFARAAVEFALRYAEASGAELTVALAPEPRRSAGEHAAEERDARGEDVEGEKLLERISGVFRATDVRPRILRAPAHDRRSPLEEVAAGAYDLVVLGAENRAVQHRLFFGHDYEVLIRESPVSVAIVVPNLARLAASSVSPSEADLRLGAAAG